jgi:hypothetical protein
MQFSALVLALATAATSNAAAIRARQSFTTTNYDDLSISGGVAGNAQQEALDILRGPLPANAADVSEEDLDFLDNVNSIANDAETEAFNVAIDGAEGEEAEALEVSF